MTFEDDYWRLAEWEKQFNTIQIAIRGLASTWLLGAFGAVGWLIQGANGQGLLVSRVGLVFVVSVMATLGLFLLWILDQMVYHRLLDAVFLVGLKMEYDHEELPPIRAMMMASAEGTGMSKWISLFYLMPMVGFVSISLGATALYAFSEGGPLGLLMGPLAIGSVAGLVWMVRLSRSEAGLSNRARLFGDENFSRLVGGSHEGYARFARIINRGPTRSK